MIYTNEPLRVVWYAEHNHNIGPRPSPAEYFVLAPAGQTGHMATLEEVRSITHQR